MAEPNNNQMAFWEAMKEKYERRNESLKQQEVCLRKRLEQLKQIMEKQKTGDDCDCVPEKLEKPSLVQCLVEKGKSLILGSCKCGDPKIGEDLLCACHIQDPKAPLNVDPNLCPLQEPSPPEGCLNPTCDFYDPTLAHLADNPSTFSLKTTDIYYMDKLADLVKAEKSMQDKIEDLENREHSYLTAIHDLQEAMKKQPKTDPINKEFKKLTQGLEEENKKLKNELEDLRLELKHCFERVEGPLRRSLEDQRDKCSNLENELKDFQARTKHKEDSYLKEINEVKGKLCQACCTMVDLNNVNAKLKSDLGSLQNKCSNLEDELLKQQLKEAENILKFKNALSKRSPRNKIQAKGDESEQDLSHIAKKLGDTLKEVCPCVSDVPSGLAETAENIRQLTELVGEKGAQQRKKRKGKIPQKSTSSCSCGSDAGACISTPPKPRESADSCACSNSSLRLRPKVGKNDFVDCSSSATLVSVPTMDLCTSKQTYNPKPSATVKKTASKGCTCCPAINECDQTPTNVKEESIETLCCCSDMDNKKIGPSEEVIAVKHLGTLSMPPGEVIVQAVKALAILSSEPPKSKHQTSEPPKSKDQSFTRSRREKLAVDTTCDVLDTPPKDIHVVTTIAKTGSLEITTEGPPGIIETKVNYLPDGKVEIVTKLIDRHNMDNFLDGTLLHVPEGPPECDESHTCQGQCEDKTISAETGCPEIDCNKSKTCGGLCDQEVEVTECKAMVEVDRKVEDICNQSPYGGQVLVDNNFTLFGGEATNPFMTQEWKNSKFQEDPAEESSRDGMVIADKPRGRRQEKTTVHADVSSEQETFRLSSRQSLTDVEKCAKGDKISCSSGSFVFPDVLDTISEGDEEQTDPSRTDNEDVIESEERSESEDSLKEFVREPQRPGVIDGRGDSLDDSKSSELEESVQLRESPAVEELKEDEIVGYSPSKINEEVELLQNEIGSSNTILQQQDESIASSDMENPFQESLPTVSIQRSDKCPDASSLCSKTNDLLQEPSKTLSPEEKELDKQESPISEIKSPSQESLNMLLLHGQKAKDEDVVFLPVETKRASQESLTNSKSATTFESMDMRSECQVTESFYKLSRNVNVLSGRITLKQSKSMFEKKGNRSEYLRICKSATLSLGSLKIDLDRLRLSKDPNVGDFGVFRNEESDRVSEDVQIVDDGKESSDFDAEEKSITDVLKEGCNLFETFPPISEQTYQCYVCSCSNQKDKDNKQNKNDQCSRNNQNLEQRIDRLLDIDPLTVSNNRKRQTENCRCARKKEDKADPTRKRCKCGTGKEDPMIPKVEGPEHQGDNVEHGENCTCVDCICNPCNFKKETALCDCGKCECGTCCDKNEGLASLVAFQLPEPQEIVVMNVGMPCDCGGKCPCSPCMDDSKKPKPPSRQQPKPQPEPKAQGKAQEASCKRCASRVQGAQIAVGSSKTRTEPYATSPESRLPDTWKTVVGCPCPPSPDDKKAVCDCKTCECKPCGYPEKARKPCDCKPPKKEPKPYGPSGKCDCSTCKCEYCGDSSIGDVKRDSMKGDSSTIHPNSAINCNCQLCECLFCSDAKTRKQSQPIKAENQAAPKKEDCACKPKCLCETCPVLSEKIGDVNTSQNEKCGCKPKCLCDKCPVLASSKGDAVGPKCDCTKCECNPCFDPHSLAVENFNEYLREVKKTEKIEITFDKKVPCDCATCQCEDCMAKHKDSDKNRGDTSEKIVPCDCATCECDTCMGKPAIVEKNKGDSPDKTDALPTVTPMEKNQCPCMQINGNEPLEECRDCGICCSIHTNVSPEEKDFEIIPKSIPCDCRAPCPCSPCPDPKIVGTEGCQIIGDADRAKREIKNVLDRIGCACDQVEVNLKPLVKQASNFETTISRMKMKLNSLQQKCTDKDQIIGAMTNELRMRSQSGVFADLLHDLAHPKERFTPDFTRTNVCDFLPKPKHVMGARLQQKRSSLCRFDNRLEPILELDRYLPGSKDDGNVCPRNLDVSGMEIIDIRRVTIDSILMKWKGPPNVNGVHGYQIFVNDELKYRVLSPNRTNAVIDSLDLSSSLEIMLFAITSCGRCEPPALATYKI